MQCSADETCAPADARWPHLRAARLWELARAQGACEAETAGLRGLARGVQLDITAPADLRSGGVVRVAWRAASPLPAQDAGLCLVVAIPGEVRIEAPPLPKPAPEQAGPGRQSAPDLPGVLALPATARAPLDLAFGAGKTRLLVPLHQPGSKLAGSVDVRVFDAGRARDSRPWWWRRPHAGSATWARPSGARSTSHPASRRSSSRTPSTSTCPSASSSPTPGATACTCSRAATACSSSHRRQAGRPRGPQSQFLADLAFRGGRRRRCRRP